MQIRMDGFSRAPKRLRPSKGDLLAGMEPKKSGAKKIFVLDWAIIDFRG
jgi:hypothetical protein